jgi:hypothetical protein
MANRNKFKEWEYPISQKNNFDHDSELIRKKQIKKRKEQRNTKNNNRVRNVKEQCQLNKKELRIVLEAQINKTKNEKELQEAEEKKQDDEVEDKITEYGISKEFLKYILEIIIQIKSNKETTEIQISLIVDKLLKTLSNNKELKIEVFQEITNQLKRVRNNDKIFFIKTINQILQINNTTLFFKELTRVLTKIPSKNQLQAVQTLETNLFNNNLIEKWKWI